MAKKPAKKGPTLIQRSRRISAGAKALFNHGPGKKSVYREFFGLSSLEEAQLEDFVGRRLDVNLKTT